MLSTRSRSGAKLSACRGPTQPAVAHHKHRQHNASDCAGDSAFANAAAGQAVIGGVRGVRAAAPPARLGAPPAPSPHQWHIPPRRAQCDSRHDLPRFMPTSSAVPSIRQAGGANRVALFGSGANMPLADPAAPSVTLAKNRFASRLKARPARGATGSGFAAADLHGIAALPAATGALSIHRTIL